MVHLVNICLLIFICVFCVLSCLEGKYRNYTLRTPAPRDSKRGSARAPTRRAE
jgi:hypothetical protein